MRVVFASPGFSPSRIGRQPWAYVDRVARGLGEGGFDVRVLTDQRTSDGHEKGVPYAIGICPSMMGLRSWLQGPPEDLFRDLGAVDVLVSFLAWPNIPAWPRSPEGTLQVVALTSPLLNNGEWRNVLREADTAAGGLHILLSQLAASGLRPDDFASFDGAVAASPPVHAYLSRRLDGRHLLNAPSGVDGDVLDYAPELRKEKGRGDPMVTYCGPPRRSRGLHVFFEALRALQYELPDVRAQFLLRPDSPRDEVYVRWVVRGVASLPDPDRVFVRSTPLPRHQFLRALANSAVCAFPFQYPVSLTPLTVLEAVAMGIPAVVTPVGELPQIVGKGGLTAEGWDSPMIAAALRDILELRPEDSQIRHGPRPPTWDKVASQWAGFLDSLS